MNVDLDKLLKELETLTYSFDGRAKMREIIGRYKDGPQEACESKIKEDEIKEGPP